MKRNLILIHRGPEYERDFDEIAARVNAIDRGITVYHLPYKLKAELPDSAWQYPTLTVALTSSFRLPVKRGPILRNAPIGKLEQQEIFRRNGIATPPATAFRFGMKLDPILFGEFVILKPMDLRLTSTGENIQLMRRRRAETCRPDEFASTHPLRRAPESYMVQRFIDTGEHISYNRVQTFFGALLFCNEAVAAEPRPPLTSEDGVIEKIQVANLGIERKHPYRLHADPDVIAMGQKVHAILTDVPLLGVDVIREAKTGKHYVLECNAGGNGWHFSAGSSVDFRQQLGLQAGSDEANAEAVGRQRLLDQFGAFDRAAETLVRKVHLLAA